ncbi:MAG: hypothetical protein KF886_17890 [Candidatus Hydrogenedentes bacterium]|nr:hypothetical protein [Candidatus Hydrogenedentota bacterium]
MILLIAACFHPAARAQDAEAAPDTVVEEAASPEAAAEAPPEDAAPESEGDEAPAEEDSGETPPDAGEAPETRAATAPWYRGSFEAEIDSVISGGGNDWDLSEYLRLEMDPPQMPRLHLRGSLWLHQDLSSDRGKPNTLRDINDASASDVQARLLYLYADIDGVLGDQSVLRLGRHRIREGATYNRVDGLYLKKRHDRLEWYGFIGARASIYRDTSDDLVLGGGVAFIPGVHTRLALDGYYAEESRYGVARARRSSLLGGFNRPIANEINDSRVTLSLWHSFGVNTRLFARLGTLGGDVNELVLSLNGYIPRLDLLYDVDYRQLFDTTGDTTADLSPFYQILGQYRQHKTLYIGLHRPITKRVTLSLEGEIRDAKNDDFYTGSRDYYRLATVLYVEDLYREFDVSTSLEYWDTSEGEGYWTVTGEVERKWETVKWRAGVDFVRYKDRVIEYDYRTARLNDAIVALLPGVYPGRSFFAQYAATRVVDTRENVYSIFTDIEWEFRKDQELFAKVSFEEDDAPDSPYWRLRAGYRIRF